MKISDLIKNLVTRARTKHPSRYSFRLLLNPFDFMRFRPAIEREFFSARTAFYYDGVRVSMSPDCGVEIGSPKVEVV